MKVSIIIPNYNGANLLERNIPYVLKAVLQVPNTEILVIDDASTDNSNEVLDRFKKDIQIIHNSKNIGFAGSVNKAVKESSGEILVLLNSDVQPEMDFLKPLLRHFEDEKVFAVGCLDKSIENGKMMERGRGIGKWHKGFLIHERGEVNKNNTLWASGGSSAFRKKYWVILGGFSRLYYPFYWEDIDLSYRAWKYGWKIIFEKESIVVHQHKEGAILKNYPTDYIKTIAYKNQFIFVWKNIRDFKYILSHLMWLPYHFIVAAKNLDILFVLGFLYALPFVPEIVIAIIKDRFIKSDYEVINQFSNEIY